MMKAYINNDSNLHTHQTLNKRIGLNNLQWLHRTFGRENTVSAVLHMGEHTPHIHATVVPIVTGERRKAKKKQADKRTVEPLRRGKGMGL